MKIHFLALSCAVLGSLQAHAQSPAPTPAAPPLPEGPLLRPAASFSHWTVAYTYVVKPDSKESTKGTQRDSSANLGNRPLRAEVTCTDPIIHEQVTTQSGDQSDVWFSGKIQYAKPQAKADWTMASDIVTNGQHTENGYSPLPANKFRDLQWISSETYAGTLQTGQGAYLMFVPGGYKTLNLNDPNFKKQLESQRLVAYIDANSRLPYSVRTNDQIATYHFEDPPTQMQTLPTELVSIIKQNEAAVQRMIQRPPRPY